MSSVIRDGLGPEPHIEALRLREVSQEPDELDVSEALLQMPTVIRNVDDSLYTVTEYTLSDAGRDSAQLQLANDQTINERFSHTRPLPANGESWGEGEAEGGDQRDPKAVLQQAQAEAEQCLALAQSQAEAIKEQARTDGLQTAAVIARQEVSAQFSDVFASLAQAADNLIQARSATLRTAEEDIVNLAFQLARKIVDHDVSCNRQVIRSTLGEALDYLVEQDRVLIHVNPADLEQAQGLCQELGLNGPSSDEIGVQADATIAPGGCLIHSDFGTIDARIETKFDELIDQLGACVESEGIGR